MFVDAFQMRDFAQGKKDARVAIFIMEFLCIAIRKKNLITYFCEPWLKDHPAIRKGLLGMGMMHSHSSRTLNVKILDMCISFGHCNLALATHFLYSSM